MNLKGAIQFMGLVVPIFAAVLPLLLLRSLPFILCVVASRGVTVVSRLLAILFYSGLVSAAHFFKMDAQDLVMLSAVTFGYFFVAALYVHGLLLLNRRIGFGRLITFILCLIPGSFAPSALVEDPYRITVLVVGWEFSLAAYSYLMDQRKVESTASLLEGLFFLLVNPTLVYSSRGHQTGGFNLSFRSWGRILQGIVSVAMCLGIRYVAIGQGLLQGFLLASPLKVFLMVISEYFVQSGRASIENRSYAFYRLVSTGTISFSDYFEEPGRFLEALEYLYRSVGQEVHLFAAIYIPRNRYHDIIKTS